MSHDLDRFIKAQDLVYDDVLAELRAGLKTSHWMWFIFPQIAGLGSSAMSRRYAINDADEARAYLHHVVLGARLRECVSILLTHDRTARAIFGSVDAMKLHSSLTLFAGLSEPGSIFHQALDRFFEGKRDDQTTARLTES